MGTTTEEPPAGPVRKRRTAGWVAVGVIAVCGVCAIAAISRLNSTSRPETHPAGNQAPRAVPGIGAPARDGALEFTVRRVKCGSEQVGDVVQKNAAGQYCIVELTVRNVGDTPRGFYNTNQEAHSADGTRFEPDWEATDDALNGEQKAAEAINPGTAIDAIVVYDIPKDAKIQTLTLHDSAMSNGVVIRVS
jgi:hypothetical protein